MPIDLILEMAAEPEVWAGVAGVVGGLIGGAKRFGGSRFIMARKVLIAMGKAAEFKPEELAEMEAKKAAK